MSASPISPTREVAGWQHKENEALSTTASAPREPSSPIKRKEVLSAESSTDGAQVVGVGAGRSNTADGPDGIETERKALEERRARILAEKEHLRRLRELEEEERSIEQRLSTLGPRKSP
jgi:hypothetical protein